MAVLVIAFASFQLFADASAHRVSIKPSGSTMFSASSQGVEIKITIKTRQIENGIPSRPDDEAIKSGCTNTRFPCSKIETISILVNSHELILPSPITRYLADVATGEIIVERGKYVLRMYGGDASEAYFTDIQFNNCCVIRQTMWSAEFPGRPTSDIAYSKIPEVPGVIDQARGASR